MVKNKLFVLLLLSVFLVSFGSAAEFDNYIQDYNQTTETITFSNCAIDLYFGCAIDGSDIGQVQLKTPRDFKVARGYNYVWEMDAWVYDDYNDFLKGFEFEDWGNGKTKVNRDIDIKILSYKDVEVEDYYYDCYEVWNATNNSNIETCDKIQNGTHLEQKETWTKVTPADIKKADGKITLRGYTDVQEGDYIDWSPLIFGVRVPHEIWASWTQSLNVDIISYYKLDRTTGLVIDELGVDNGTNTGSTRGVTGKKNKSFEFDGSNDIVVYNSNPFLGLSDFSISLWANPDGSSQDFALSTSVDYSIFMRFDSDEIQFYLYTSGGAVPVTYSFTPSSSWVYVVLTYDGSDMRLYVDGVLRDVESQTGSIVGGGVFQLGANKGPTPTAWYNGKIDEVAIWGRVLDDGGCSLDDLCGGEIEQTYNEGDGITYTTEFGTPPSVILTSPVDDAQLTSASVDHVATITDSQFVENVTLYIDGVAEETRTTHVNGTYTFTKTVSLGVHNWSILAWNNQSLSNQSTTWTYNYTGIPPTVTLISPADEANLTSASVTHQATVTDPTGVLNVTLYLDGVANETDTSGTNGSYSFTKIIAEGVHIWSILAYDNEGQQTQSINRTYNYTQPPVFVVLISPDDDSIHTIATVNMTCFGYESNGVTELNMTINGVLNQSITNSTPSQNLTISEDITFAEGDYTWNCTVAKDDVTTNSPTRSFSVDLSPPVINILYPIATTYDINVSDLNYSVSDLNPDKCWYSIDGGVTNSTPVSSTNFTGISSFDGVNIWNVYCNDTIGNIGNSSVSFIRDTLDVVLNSPPDDYTTLIPTVVFNATANSTIGESLANMSLWSNVSGSWAINDTTVFGSGNYFYSGFNFNTRFSDNPNVAWNGTNIIVQENNRVESYDLSGNYISTIATSIDDQDVAPQGLVFVGTDFWIVGFEDGYVHKYNSAGIYTGINFSFSSQNTRMFGIAWDGTFFWLASDSDRVYKYNSVGTYTGTSFSTSSQTTNANGVTFDGTHLWVADSSGGGVYKYTTSGVYTGDGFNVGGQSTSMRSIAYNGNGFYMSDTSNDNVYRYDLNSTTSATTIFTLPIVDPTIWNVESCTASGGCSFATSNRTVFPDTSFPNIIINAPTGVLGSGVIGNPETLNVTFTSIHLDSCWYNYNGTNVSIEGCVAGITNITSFILEDSNFDITVYANDTFGNTNSSTSTWSYLIEDVGVDFHQPVTEGTPNTITQTLVINGGGALSASILDYNGTNYTTSIFFDGGEYILSTTVPAPSVITIENITFRFYVEVDSTWINLRENSQLVIPLNFSSCSSGDVLLNLSLFDEKTREAIDGTIEVNADLISLVSGTAVETVAISVEDQHNLLICLDPINSTVFFSLNAEIRYFSDGYVTELYYIQEADLDEHPISVSLFPLTQNDSTEFVVTYKNNAFIFIEGAIIQLQRKYIGEDIFEVVEAPLTSDGGKAVLHIDLNTNRYRASVVKDGELLDFFENIVFSCENELAGDCTYSLDGTVDPNNDVPIETITDFAYSISIDEINQTVTVAFAVPSGVPASVNVALDQIDMFGNLTSCNTTIITSAGSITCDYTDSIDRSILKLSISKDDVQLAVLNYMNDPDLDMDGMNFFVAFLMMISLVGMAIASPEWMILISVMVLIISGTMFLLKGMSLVMGLGAIAWVIIAAAIIIMKMSKQEDR